MRRVARCLAVPIALAGAVVFADEGRIPIEALGTGPPYTITQPGSYVVTRDVSVAMGDIVIIQANDVTLDLNGKVLSSDSAGEGATGKIVSIVAPYTRTTVLNGRIVGGDCGICGSGLTVHGIQMVDSGEGISAGDLILRNSSVIAVYGGVVASGSAEIVGNRIEVNRSIPATSSFGIQVGSGGVVELNTLVFPLMYDGYGLSLGGGATVVRGNSFHCPGCNDTTGISVNSDANIIMENSISGFGNFGINMGGDGNLVRSNVFGENGYAEHGILVSGTRNRIEGNVVRTGRFSGIELGSGNSCIGNHVDVVVVAGVAIQADSLNRIEGNELHGHGGSGVLYINGDQNHIERNFVGPSNQPSSPGLVFNAGADGNSYRNNILRGGSGGASVEDNGTGNVNAGGNICAGTCP